MKKYRTGVTISSGRSPGPHTFVRLLSSDFMETFGDTLVQPVNGTEMNKFIKFMNKINFMATIIIIVNKKFVSKQSIRLGVLLTL